MSSVGYRPNPFPFCLLDVTAYVVQAVQTRPESSDATFTPLPLIEGGDATLRVFVASGDSAVVGNGFPEVTATLYPQEVELEPLNKPSRIPPEIDEGNPDLSAQFAIQGRYVAPGLEMVVEIALPDSTVRIPDTGRMKVDVRDVQPLNLFLIPYQLRSAPDPGISTWAKSLTPSDPLFAGVRDWLPVDVLRLAVADSAIWTSTTDADTLLAEVVAGAKLRKGTRPWYIMGIGRMDLDDDALGIADTLPIKASFVRITDDPVVNKETVGARTGSQHEPWACAMWTRRAENCRRYVRDVWWRHYRCVRVGPKQETVGSERQEGVHELLRRRSTVDRALEPEEGSEVAESPQELACDGFGDGLSIVP